MDPVLIGNCIAIYVVVAIAVAASASAAFDRQYLVKGIVGALWPLIGAIALVCLPFLVIGRLGEWAGSYISNRQKRGGEQC